jgi:membrane protein
MPRKGDGQVIRSAGSPGRRRATASGTHANRAPERLDELSKTSWLGVLRRARAEFRKDGHTDWAAALTYYSVLALFPGLLVLVSLLGLLGRSATQQLLDNVGQISPGGVRSFFEQIVTNAQQQHTTAGVLAIVGLLASFWSASSYIAAFMRAANAIYDMGEGRPIWKTIPTRILVTLLVLMMMLASAIIVMVSGRIADQVGQALGVGHTGITVWNLAKWPVLLVIASLILAILYWACPNVKQPGFRWITPGGVLAVVIWLAASGGFAVYVANFATYDKTYGSVAGVIIFLVWLCISNIAVLLGAEFNAELVHARAIHAGLPADVQPFVEPKDTRKLDADEQDRAQALSRRLHPDD